MSPTSFQFDGAAISVALNNATELVKSYQHSEASKAISAMLGALASWYVVDLVNCDPKDFAKAQSVIRQLLELQKVINGGEYDTARIDFSSSKQAG